MGFVYGKGKTVHFVLLKYTVSKLECIKLINLYTQSEMKAINNCSICEKKKSDSDKWEYAVELVFAARALSRHLHSPS